MALLNCNECGQMISDKAVTCPHCGAPVTSTTNISEISAHASTSTLRIVRVGKSPIVNVTLIVKSNGMIVGIYHFDVGFDMEIPAASDMELIIRCQGIDTPTRLTLDPDRNYVCKVYYSTTFSYELYDANGTLEQSKKKSSKVLRAVIIGVIAGIVCGFMTYLSYL